ncbi:MAG: hypothetical protein ACSHX9_14430 [Luteolibacter sp.]
MIHRTTIYTLILGLTAVSLSCKDEEIRTYRVAAEESTPTTVVSTPSLDLAQPKTAGSLRWQALEGWQEETPGQFQAALYKLSEKVNVSVSSLPGEAGGESANVNRWRRQVGLDAVEDVGGRILGVEGDGISAKWFEIIGESNSIIAAIISLPAETWFFKLNAPTGEIEPRKEEFMAFLSTVSFGSEAPQPPSAPAPSADKPKISLEAPEGWEKSEGSSMRVASFRIPGIDTLDGDVSVVPLFGQAGTALENVNRWRGQLKLPPLESETDPALGETKQGSSGNILFTHMVSDGPLLDGEKKGAISTGILRAGDYTWFFKMGGDSSLVEANRAKFEAFVLTAEIP